MNLTCLPYVCASCLVSFFLLHSLPLLAKTDKHQIDTECHIKIVNPADGNTEVPINATLSIYYTTEHANHCNHVALYESDHDRHVHTHTLYHKEWKLSLLSIYLGEIKVQARHVLKPHTPYYLVFNKTLASHFITNSTLAHEHHDVPTHHHTVH